MAYNAPVHHVNRYVRPKRAVFAVFALNGNGIDFMSVSRLNYTVMEKQRASKEGWTEIDGRVRIDHHEWRILKGNDGRLHKAAMMRGGAGHTDLEVPYGHVYLSDLEDNPGTPVPAGSNGSAIVMSPIYRCKVTSMPPDALYKRFSPGSMYQTYAWPAARWGNMDSPKYSMLNWSWINIDGGGMCRGVVQDGQLLRNCSVTPIRHPMYNSDGDTIGETSAHYVRTANAYGWFLWGHRLNNEEDWTYHVERTMR